MVTGNDNGIVLIGAGLPRTGTLSLKYALEHLLGGKCYHMVSNLHERDRKEHISFWKGLQTGDVPVTPDSFKEFFDQRDFVAGVDFPFSNYYKILMEAYPNAKVILTVRDPGRWFESTQSLAQIQSIAKNPPYAWFLWCIGLASMTNMAVGVNPQLRQLIMMNRDKEGAVDFYEKWVNDVKCHVPKDRLLVFSVKDGWGPVSTFLNVPVPTIDFPNVNDKATMQRRYRYIKSLTWIALFVIGLVFAGIVSYVL